MTLAFEDFVLGSSTQLLRTAMLLVGDRDEAEDLLQGTLLRLSRRWSMAQVAPEAYAHRVLINLNRDRHRRAGRRVTEVGWREPVAGAGAGQLHVDHADAVAGRDELIAALARLPHRQREVLVLRFYADLSVAETAAATGTPEGTVKSDTSRALAALRALLTAKGEVTHER